MQQLSWLIRISVSVRFSVMATIRHLARLRMAIHSPSLMGRSGSFSSATLSLVVVISSTLLKDQYGSLKYEYWNAGVESFNTVQEVRYYKHFNRAVRPDEVFLTFHLNDFETTPVAFREANGGLVVYAPNAPLQRINPWLFQQSYLYRSWIGVTTARKTKRVEIVNEVGASLEELKRMVDADGARLTVLVLPILRPLNDWNADYRENRRRILDILGSLRLRYFDLLEPLNQAFADGISVVETGDDLFWHPSPEVAKYFGAYLRRQGLLESSDGL